MPSRTFVDYRSGTYGPLHSSYGHPSSARTLSEVSAAAASYTNLASTFSLRSIEARLSAQLSFLGKLHMMKRRYSVFGY